jgi:hypothetical protein
MSLEETLIGAAVTAGVAKLMEPAAKPTKQKAQKLRDRIDILEAERLVLTIELRSALMREAKKLLPAAIRQARGDAKKRRPGSPALLRLIARLAMRDTRIDRTPPKR